RRRRPPRARDRRPSGRRDARPARPRAGATGERAGTAERAATGEHRLTPLRTEPALESAGLAPAAVAGAPVGGGASVPSAGAPGTGVTLGASQLERLLARGRLRATLTMLGPAFVAAIAYVDPGNFATNIS